MDKNTLMNLQKVAMNYLSVVGIWENKTIEKDNPISNYVLDNLSLTDDIPLLLSTDINKSNYDNTFIDVDVSYGTMEDMLEEAYSVYLKCDNIMNEQRLPLREILSQIIQSSDELDEYLQEILDNFKESICDLVIEHESTSLKFNNIKCNILEIKMNEYAINDDFDNAICLRDIINNIKEKGE